MIITIAWVSNDGARSIQELERFDGVNWRHKQETCPKAHAVVWLNEGARDDANKAREHARQAHGDKLYAAVFTLPVSEQDPLGVSRERVMEMFSQAQAQEVAL